MLKKRLEEEEKACCFAIIVLYVYYYYKCYMTFPRDANLQCVIVVFPNDTHLLFGACAMMTKISQEGSFTIICIQFILRKWLPFL